MTHGTLSFAVVLFTLSAWHSLGHAQCVGADYELLSASDLQSSRFLGAAVAIDGDVAVVGAQCDSNPDTCAGAADRIGHVSTGGGAALKLLAGQSLPGVEILRRKS